MNYTRLKKEGLKCKFCPQTIQPDTLAVKESFRGTNGKWIYFFYHEDCYVEKEARRRMELKNTYVRKELESKGKKKQLHIKIGRPPKYSDRFKSVNIKNKIRYHEGLQHKEEVARLKEELISLEIGASIPIPEPIKVESKPVVVDTPVPIKQEVTTTPVKSGLISRMEDDPMFAKYAKKEV